MKYIIIFLAILGIFLIIFINLFPNAHFLNKYSKEEWTIKERKQNNHVEALLKYGVFKSANTLPIYTIRLQTPSMSRLVWESQVKQQPNIEWVDKNTLLITQRNHLILSYRPRININGQIYNIELNILPSLP